MRAILLSVLCFVSTAAHAVTVDFESDISNVSAFGFSSQDFDFASSGLGNWYFSGGAGGTTGASVYDPGCGGCVPVGWTITASGGSAFSLESVDLAFFGFASPTVVIYGNLSGGGTVSRTVSTASWHTESAFGAPWSNLASVGIYFNDGVPDTLTIDNFSATVVPVPAAFWLFISALGGLGWLRRKQTHRDH